MKKSATYFVFLLSLYTSAFGQVNLTDQLLLEYFFSGNALDQSGNNVNAIANGGPVFTNDRFGSANSAYEFDGADDYLSMSATTLKATQYSYSIWAYPTSTENISCLLSIGSNEENQAVILSFTNGWVGGSYLSTGDTYLAESSTAPDVNKWYHIVVTRNNNLVQIYINGDSISSTDISNVAAAYGTSPLANIGRRSNSESQYFKGKIDDVRIYGRVINKTEVKALYEETEVDPTSLNARSNLDFRIAPNPTSDLVKIELQKTSNYEVSVYNSMGNLILNRKYTGITSISDLSLENEVNGVYLIMIKSSDGIGTQRIVLDN